MEDINTYALTWSEITSLTLRVGLGIPKQNTIIDILAEWELGNAGITIYKLFDLDNPKTGWRKQMYGIYLFPNNKEELIQKLAEMSLNFNIIMLKNEDYSYCVYMEESKDGSTNIDADVIGAFVDAIDRNWI